MRLPSLCLVAILTFMPLSSATAQATVRPGERVRITVSRWSHSGGGRYVGTLVASTPDRLVVETEGDTLALPLDSWTRLEVVQGQKSHTAMGALIGSLIGGTAGAVIGYASWEENEECPECWNWGPEVPSMGGFVIGLLGGALVGAIVGDEIKTDRWKEVPVDRLQVRVDPLRGGRFSFGASVRF
jgi:hypothetical protein